VEDGLLGFLEETTTKQLCLVQQRRVCSLSAAVYFLFGCTHLTSRSASASREQPRPPARAGSPVHVRRIFFLALACLLAVKMLRKTPVALLGPALP
jgi:hypothetical protein